VKAIIHRVTRNWKSFFLSIFMQDLIVLGRLSKEVPSQLSRHINLSPRCNIRKYREFFGCITLCYFLFHDCRHKYYFLASEYLPLYSYTPIPPLAMSFIPRVWVPARTRLAGVAVAVPGSLFSSSSRLYSTSKSTFSPHDIHNVTHHPDHIQSKMPAKELLRNNHRFSEFDLEGRVYAITGGGRGLGLSMAEALVEAGAKGIDSLVSLRLSN
jgi:hypothetical protein